MTQKLVILTLFLRRQKPALQSVVTRNLGICQNQWNWEMVQVFTVPNQTAWVM